MTADRLPEAEQDPAFEALLEFLQAARGFDFRGYKRASLTRRISNRMRTVDVASFGDYQDYMEVYPEEYARLFDSVFINVTAFFRDEDAWTFVREDVVPRIVSRADASRPIRVWCCGCATGEEAFTLAMIFEQIMGAEACQDRVKIYATDVDEGALEVARRAVYTQKAVEAVPEELRATYFEQSEEGYAFRRDPRRQVIFGRHDLTSDAPISRLDLLVCRNTLMYFNAETQRRILDRFHFALRDDGYLFLGRAEMLLTQSDLFKPRSIRHRVFSKVPSTVAPASPPADRSGLPQSDPDEAAFLRTALLAFDSVGPPHLVVDARGVLVHANESARGALDLKTEDLKRPVRDLGVFLTPTELGSLVREARGILDTVVRDVAVESRGGEVVTYWRVKAMPLRDAAGAYRGTSIRYEDRSGSRRLAAALRASEERLSVAHLELQTATEELETTNEEIQSTNEELETTNEELQATNEELETMNEELQSTNEELRTMNEELRVRGRDLDHLNACLQAVQGSVQVGLVYLNQSLEVLLWNERATDLWGLRGDEVVGRNFTELDIGLPVREIGGPILAVLEGNASSDVVTVSAVNRRGQQIQCRISLTTTTSGAESRRGVVLLMEQVYE